MAQWLGTLLNLQKIDLRIRDLRHRLALLPGEMENLMRKRSALEAADAAAAAAVRKLEADIRRGETEVERLNADSQRLQQQSVMVKTNAEYTAMLSTIAHNRERVGELEEQILELMDRLDAEKCTCARTVSDNAAEIKNLKTEFAELLAFADEVKAELARLTEQRKSSGFGIDPAVASRYNTLLNGKKGGTPVVPVENGICGNCHLKLTPQTLIQIRQGGVGSCDNCQHLVYDPAAADLSND